MMNDTNKMIHAIIEKFKKIKNVEIIIAIVIVVIIISLSVSTFTKPVEKNSAISLEKNSNEIKNTNDKIEEKLIQILKAIDGAGEVKVMITYESGPEIVPALDTVKSDSAVDENDAGGGTRTTKTSNDNSHPVSIQQSNGSQALIIKERNPEVRGVIVIAQGAGNIRVKMDLLKAVETVLKVSPEYIDVFPMKKGK